MYVSGCQDSRESMVSDIPAVEGKTGNLFYSVDTDITVYSWFNEFLDKVAHFPRFDPTLCNKGQQWLCQVQN